MASGSLRTRGLHTLSHQSYTLGGRHVSHLHRPHLYRHIDSISGSGRTFSNASAATRRRPQGAVFCIVLTPRASERALRANLLATLPQRLVGGLGSRSPHTLCSIRLLPMLWSSCAMLIGVSYCLF